MGTLRWKVLVVAVALTGCSSSSSKGASNNEPANSIAANNVRGEVCADDVEFCRNAACRLCRYEREVVTETGASPVLGYGSELVMAYFDESSDELRYARRTAPREWSEETAWTAESGWQDASIRIAVADDETPWITIVDSNRAVTLVTREAGEWTSRIVDGAVDVAPVAVDSDGNPWVLHNRTTGDLELSGLVNGDWQKTTVDAGNAYFSATAITSSDDLVWVAWTNHETSELKVASWDGSDLDAEVAISDVAPDQGRGSLSIATSSERVGVAGGSRVALRTSDGWSATSTNAHGNANVLLLPDDGSSMLVAYEFFGLAVAEQFGPQWPSQLVSTECDDGSLDALFDPDGTLLITYWCHGAVELIEQTGFYDVGYADSCRTLTAQFCEAALECNPDASDVSGDLCLFKSEQGSSRCINVPYCEREFYGVLCGDASQDPALVGDCRNEADTAVCHDDGDDGGIILPDACPFL